MPTQCPHGRVVDWGDFGDPGDAQRCPRCDAMADRIDQLSQRQRPTAGSKPFDTYVVHASLYRAEDDDPPPGISLMMHARVWRTDDPQADEELAAEAALRDLRPYLNNSTHVKTLAVLT